jgi:hypothetical protein
MPAWAVSAQEDHTTMRCGNDQLSRNRSRYAAHLKTMLTRSHVEIHVSTPADLNRP